LEYTNSKNCIDNTYILNLMKINHFIIQFLIFTVTPCCALLVVAQSSSVPYGDNPKAGKYAQINGIKMYYETYGSGQPLVMFHGNGGSINAFVHQIPFFEKHYQVIAIDSRLHGKSEGSADTLSYEMMAADFACLLDHLKIDSAYILGWSDGGNEGIILAMNYPKKVRKLAISGANIVPDTTALYPADLEGMWNKINDLTSTVRVKTLNRMMIFQPQIPYSALSKISCPTLVIAGDRDMIRPEHTLKIFQSIPKASLCIFPNSYHHVCQQHPQLFNEAVLAFFEK